MIDLCDKVHNMSKKICHSISSKNRLTIDLEVLFDDLEASIEYCKEKAQSKQVQIASFHPSASSSSSSSNLLSADEVADQEDESEGRGSLKHGFFKRYVGR